MILPRFCRQTLIKSIFTSQLSKGPNLNVKVVPDHDGVGASVMLDRMVEKARQQVVFIREDIPTKRRLLGA